MEQLINRIRFFHFISGVLVSRQADPICGHCKAFINTVEWAVEGISNLQAGDAPEKGRIPQEIPLLLSEAERKTADISVADDAVGQKKAGNCMMPKGLCFVKIPKSILEEL